MAISEGGSVSVADLPDECLLLVFERLKSCSDSDAFGLTCRRWLQIQNLGRKSLRFRCSYNAASSRDYVIYLSRLLIRFQQLEDLSLAGCTELPDSALSELQSWGSKLQSLSLDCCFEITDKGLNLVSTGCSSLVSISLYRCNITDSGLENLAKSCSALENVNLAYCTLLSDRGIKALSRECFKLRALTMSNCKGITGIGLNGCSPTLTYLEAESCLLTPEGLNGAVNGGGLEYLNISCLRSWVGGDGLAGIGAGYATRLRFLNLRLCRFVGDESVVAIAKGCALLEEWNLVLCHEVRVSGWEAIGSNCHNLEILHVNRCRNLCDRGLRALQNGCERLAVLYIHGCRKVTSIGFESFRRTRWNVKVRGEECVSVGPCMDRFSLTGTLYSPQQVCNHVAQENVSASYLSPWNGGKMNNHRT